MQVEFTSEFNEASKTIKRIWAGVNPGVKLDMRTMDVELGKMYEIVFGTLVKVLGFIAFLAITISCFGSLGMAPYTIESRKKRDCHTYDIGKFNKAVVYVLSRVT